MERLRIVEATKENQNLSKQVIGTKSSITSQISRRPALGDLGNKLGIKTTKTTNETFKKPISNNDHGINKPVLKKQPSLRAVNVKQTSSNSTVVNVNSKKVDVSIKNQRENAGKTVLLTGSAPNKNCTKVPAVCVKNVQIEKKDQVVVDPKPESDLGKSYSSIKLDIRDPDEDCKNEPAMVTEYINDIFDYLRAKEREYSVERNFLEDHATTPKMRAILVNWMIEIQMNFKLYLETLYMSVSIVDRFLQVDKKINTSCLQLVGTAALLIACKYEEIYIPDLSDFCYLSDDAFTKGQLLRYEARILRKLEFNLGKPLCIHFLRRFSKVAAVDNGRHTLGKYLLELALTDTKMATVLPSLQAAAACCLSNAIMSETMEPVKLWTPTMVHYTKYKYSDIREVMADFAKLLLNAHESKYNNAFQKYSSAKLCEIALHPKLKGRLVKALAVKSPSSNISIVSKKA